MVSQISSVSSLKLTVFDAVGDILGVSISTLSMLGSCRSEMEDRSHADLALVQWSGISKVIIVVIKQVERAPIHLRNDFSFEIARQRFVTGHYLFGRMP